MLYWNMMKAKALSCAIYDQSSSQSVIKSLKIIFLEDLQLTLWFFKLAQ